VAGTAGQNEALASVTRRIREYFASAALLPPDDAPDPPIPADEEIWGPPPNPYSDPPDGKDAWLADVPSDLLDEYLEAIATSPVAGAPPAGRWLREGGKEPGFASGGPGDQLEPGPVLAGLAAGAWGDGLGQLSDDELIGVMRAWRRLASWAAAGELAAVAEVERRRASEVAAGGDPHLLEHLDEEIAAPLTLTRRAAGRLLGFATGLNRLPATRAALAAGLIDTAKAYTLAEEVTGLDDAHAATVEATVIAKAPHQTTGQLRHAAHRAVLAADPGAAKRRYDQARLDARVELWQEPAGTAALAGRDLHAADAIAADRRIDALARQLKDTGAEGTLPQLRAKVFTALLLGQSVGASPGAEERCPGETGGERSGGGATAPLRGRVNLTMPLATWLGASEAPGEVAGYGPLPAADARALAQQLSTGRWCLTLLDRDGHAVAHGCATASPQAPVQPGVRSPGQRSSGNGASRASPSATAAPARAGPSPPGTGPPPGWALTIKLAPLAAGECDHRHQSAGYVPPARLRHLVRIRQRTCTAPGCRRSADPCDLDHTIPYAKGGRTCECNLAPLCRKHHRVKQALDWRLEQPEPGVMVWTLPHGRSYRVEPEPYPVD
jgi:hypothetical protein